MVNTADLQSTFPYNLTNPDTIPDEDEDPIYLPQPNTKLNGTQAQAYLNAVIANVTNVINSAPSGASNCTICKSALAAAKPAARAVPSLVPDAMVNLCKTSKLHSNATCEEDFLATTFGAIWTQVLAYADVKGLDGNYICQSIGSFCPRPTTSPLNATSYFSKTKPADAESRVPKASGRRVKVLHMSDFHLDPRYKVGAEASCASSLCCRANNPNPTSNGTITLPAALYGSFQCDTPYDLGTAALQAVGPLTGTSKGGEHLAWTVYTGDLVPHDPQSQLSRALTEYSEVSVYGMIKQYVTGPVFAALGNHDSNPEAIDAPHNLPGRLGQQQSWNYHHVADLWKNDGWIDLGAANQARTHYGGYSIKTPQGLRIITWNTDFWYRSNFLNYINTTNPDASGTLKWMISELQYAEDHNELVWIVGHVLSGWDGTNPLPNPTNLFYQIVERYSPHVIANVFFGHTHEDQFMIYYANNGTNQSAGNALTTGWIGPSVTPLTNLNSGFRLYEVDTGDFNIYEAYTYYSNVSTFPSLDSTGPTYEYEYSTRDIYGAQANWSTTAPLNATFWHKVTEAMEKNITLVTLQNEFQGKLSSKSPNCTNTA
ncbi:uncharacterized protein N0V89_001705 [Didymosphaeria variabile]|uniref:Calcineurin-like phosphoesterase domain-containing protein n=1 Tax=Didymosphaeria variabile TaxID=1932322 RepID=A0A9W8XQ94_9PLEO|nr:uncharacterized protein N0V89_001705 [Didymosphaeria variabile]KAJ4357130.1 hypothetical protein N0V89_001705 [Didymosphaeria variabile]